MRERFTAADRRFVLVCLGVAVVCGAITLRYFGRAFPEASIQFTVNRAQSEAVARGFLTQTGLSPQGYKHAAIFDYDDATKTFLERKLGLERAQEVYGKQVRLWRWSHRWFKPHQKEELLADVTASGEIARFARLLPEDAPGASLEPDSARVLAERFLAGRMQVRLADYDFVEGSSTQQPQRVDHDFTWKRRGLDLGDPDATYRIHASVAGDQVTGYDEHLEIPQAWQDEYARLRARNETAGLVATLFVILTGLAMVGTVVLRIRDRDVRWPVVVGFGAVTFALQLLAALNQFDLEKFAYETQDSYASFITRFIEIAVLGALAYGGRDRHLHGRSRAALSPALRRQAVADVGVLATRAADEALLQGSAAGARDDALLRRLPVDLLRGRSPGRRLGAARSAVQQHAEHRHPVGAGAVHRLLPGGFGGVPVAHVLGAVPGRGPAAPGPARAGGHRGGGGARVVHLGIRARQLPQPALLDPRRRGRDGRDPRQLGHDPLGHPGGAGLALHGGCLLHGAPHAAVGERLFRGLGSRDGRHHAGAARRGARPVLAARRFRTRDGPAEPRCAGTAPGATAPRGRARAARRNLRAGAAPPLPDRRRGRRGAAPLVPDSGRETRRRASNSSPSASRRWPRHAPNCSGSEAIRHAIASTSSWPAASSRRWDAICSSAGRSRVSTRCSQPACARRCGGCASGGPTSARNTSSTCPSIRHRWRERAASRRLQRVQRVPAAAPSRRPRSRCGPSNTSSRTRLRGTRWRWGRRRSWPASSCACTGSSPPLSNSRNRARNGRRRAPTTTSSGKFPTRHWVKRGCVTW